MSIFINNFNMTTFNEELISFLEISKRENIIYFKNSQDSLTGDIIEATLRNEKVSFTTLGLDNKISESDLMNASSIIFDNFNAFRALKTIKDSGNFDILCKILNIAKKSIFIIGETASILGQCIDVCQVGSKQIVGFRDWMAFDIIHNLCIYCDDSNNFLQHDDAQKLLCELSQEEKILAIPKGTSLHLDNGEFQLYGNGNLHMFDCGKDIVLNSNNDRKNEFQELSTIDELVDFLDSYTTYGWKCGDSLHINNLLGLKKGYKVQTYSETLQSGLATCIEHTNLIKTFMDNNKIKSKAFAYICHDDESQVRMHCFVLYREDDNWCQLEQSDPEHKGIYVYDSLDEAQKETISRYEKGGKNLLIELENIPRGMSFGDLCKYLNMMKSREH